MRKKHKILWMVLGIVLLPIFAYGVAHALAFVFPLSSQSDFYHGLFTIVLIIILLPVPYYMIKFLGHAAHIRNSNEKELNFSDLPKDKDQSDKSY